MNVSLARALTALYSSSGLLVALFYLPQLRAVWRSSTHARDVSLCTWVCWTLAALIATLYAGFVVWDGAFLAVSAANLAGCAAVSVVTIRKRQTRYCARREGERASAPR